ncbi:hypothetical protein LXL04_013773 [Taraxacum kok-saghyz]
MEIGLLQPSPYPLHFLTQTKAHTEERVRDNHCSYVFSLIRFNTGFSILCSRFTVWSTIWILFKKPNLPKPGLAQFSNQDVFPTG